MISGEQKLFYVLKQALEIKKISVNIEHYFKELLIKNNFIELKKNQQTLPDYFIYQPNGTQQSPDFHVFIDKSKKPIQIECKSSKSLKPIWNGGLPSPDEKNNYIYIFHQKQSLTFMFMAKHLIQHEEYKKHIEFHQKLQDLAKEFNMEKKTFDYYVRAMYTQKINFVVSLRSDYFNDCLEFVSNKVEPESTIV